MQMLTLILALMLMLLVTPLGTVVVIQDTLTPTRYGT